MCFRIVRASLKIINFLNLYLIGGRKICATVSGEQL
jgi:hypothetical protein